MLIAVVEDHDLTDTQRPRGGTQLTLKEARKCHRAGMLLIAFSQLAIAEGHPTNLQARDGHIVMNVRNVRNVHNVHPFILIAAPFFGMSRVKN